MNPVVITLLRTYAPVLLLPITGTIGFIGYKLEWWMKDGKDQANDKVSVLEQRENRRLQQLLQPTPPEPVVKDGKKQTIFDKKT